MTFAELTGADSEEVQLARLSRAEEVRRTTEEYAQYLREVIRRLGRKFN